MLSAKLETSYWRQAYQASLYPELKENLETDAVIIGAGITGLTTAYLLKQAGLKVVVLEKSTVGGGTTGRTTGKVTSQHNLIYADLLKHRGETAARLYGEANQSAITQIEAIIKREKINCAWQRDDNYVYTSDPKQVNKFQQEAAIAAELGLPASFEPTTPLPFEVTAAVKFSSQAKIHSQQYLSGLARAVNGDGSYVFENSNVVGIRDDDIARVKTKQGVIRAKHVIVATNVPTLPLVARGAYCALEYPMESYIVAGQYSGTLKGMYISPDKNNYSILPIVVGKEKMLLIGGASHISGVRLSKNSKFAKLAHYAQQNFGLSEISFQWSDRDYLGYDNVPLVGKLYPWSKNVYVGTAFMKWGLTNGTVAAMILRDLILGQPNEWANVYDSTRRSPIAAIPRVAARHLFR